WIWFWAVGALATLAKGPLGLLLGALGLLAWFWKLRPTSLESAEPAAAGARGKTRGPLNFWLSQFCGVGLYAVLCGGWFIAAYLKMGKPLLGVMLGQELVGHIVQEKGGGLFSQFYLPFLYVCRCFVPWVLLSLLGFYRLFRAPAEEPSARRFER